MTEDDQADAREAKYHHETKHISVLKGVGPWLKLEQ